jgi:DNA polymerase
VDAEVKPKGKSEKQAALEEIAREVSECVNCTLHQTRKKSVPGTGPVDADIMFIGEGPGFHENEQGLPFVGAAGKLLDDLLASIGFKRSDVFITNVVKCRPPGNRDPELPELTACNIYLDRQIQIINPKIIVTLGRFSMAKFMPNVKITQVHGQARWVDNRLIVAMYHPAAALHQVSLKPALEQDFKKLPELIASASQRLAHTRAEQVSPKTDSESQPPPKPQQLSLF